MSELPTPCRFTKLLCILQVTGSRSAPQFANFTLKAEAEPEGETCEDKRQAAAARANERLNIIPWSNLGNSGDPKAPQSGMAFANANANAAFICRLEESSSREQSSEQPNEGVAEELQNGPARRLSGVSDAHDPFSGLAAEDGGSFTNFGSLQRSSAQLQPLKQHKWQQRQLLNDQTRSNAAVILQGLNSVLATLVVRRP